MAAPVIETKVWTRLLNAWREDQGNVSKAARAAGISRPTARRAINDGYPDADPPRRPIRDIVAEEMVAARAAMAAEREVTARTTARDHELENAARRQREAEKARADAVEARRQEAQMVRSQRGNVLALIGINGQCLRGALQLSEKIQKELAEGDMTTAQKLTALTRLGLLTQRISSAASEVVRMERLLLGEPTEIVGSRDLSEIGFEEALAELEKSAEFAKRIRERKKRLDAFKLTLVKGGKP